ncbi:MAG: hypothetical protein ACI9KE_006080 [Polyangiales bacterium]
MGVLVRGREPHQAPIDSERVSTAEPLARVQWTICGPRSFVLNGRLQSPGEWTRLPASEDRSFTNGEGRRQT